MKLTHSFAVLAMLAMPFAQGGGLFFSIGDPNAASDPAARGAFVTARVFTCFGDLRPDWNISATAEGLVNGERVTVPLKVVRLSIPGLHAIQWTQPKEGVWVIDLRVADPYHMGVIVPVGRDGVRPQTDLVLGNPNSYQIKSVLDKAVLAELAAGT